MTKDKPKRDYIPSRYITYHFVCRHCGESDVGEFDKFKDPKNQYLLCDKCEQEIGWQLDEDDEI